LETDLKTYEECGLEGGCSLKEENAHGLPGCGKRSQQKEGNRGENHY